MKCFQTAHRFGLRTPDLIHDDVSKAGLAANAISMIQLIARSHRQHHAKVGIIADPSRDAKDGASCSTNQRKPEISCTCSKNKKPKGLNAGRFQPSLNDLCSVHSAGLRNRNGAQLRSPKPRTDERAHQAASRNPSPAGEQHSRRNTETADASHRCSNLGLKDRTQVEKCERTKLLHTSSNKPLLFLSTSIRQ